jgi:hypothetical protein
MKGISSILVSSFPTFRHKLFKIKMGDYINLLQCHNKYLGSVDISWDSQVTDKTHSGSPIQKRVMFSPYLASYEYFHGMKHQIDTYNTYKSQIGLGGRGTDKFHDGSFWNKLFSNLITTQFEKLDICTFCSCTISFLKIFICLFPKDPLFTSQ